jgi:hypothetical protein
LKRAVTWTTSWIAVSEKPAARRASTSPFFRAAGVRVSLAAKSRIARFSGEREAAR